jgi:nucleoside permease NupC
LADFLDRFINLITGGKPSNKANGYIKTPKIWFKPKLPFIPIQLPTNPEKIVTNEFVVMGEITKVIDTYSAHRRAVISTFLAICVNYFCNFTHNYKFVCNDFFGHLLCHYPCLTPFMYPFALLLGLPWGEAWIVAQQMSKKIVTNEFVVIRCALYVSITFVISPITTNSFVTIFLDICCATIHAFANFSTIGMIVGTLKGIVDKKTSDFVSKYVPMMLISLHDDVRYMCQLLL